MLAAVEVITKLVLLAKTAIGRARPPLDGMVGAPVLDYSFPSDHTASGTVVYVLGALLLTVTETRACRGRLLVTAGWVIGDLIGASSVYLGYHWFTDVVGGRLLAAFLIGIGMVFITANRRPDADLLGQVLGNIVPGTVPFGLLVETMRGVPTPALTCLRQDEQE
jgi:membrane-associated phospholipid phosphatase